MPQGCGFESGERFCRFLLLSLDRGLRRDFAMSLLAAVIVKRALELGQVGGGPYPLTDTKVERLVGILPSWRLDVEPATGLARNIQVASTEPVEVEVSAKVISPRTGCLKLFECEVHCRAP